MRTEDPDARLLDLVCGLSAEVHPRAAPRAVTLDSPFDDLGLGSLELAELLVRVQDSFAITLPAHVLTTAETPRDILRALQQGGAVSTRNAEPGPPAVTVGAPVPSATTTLTDALDWHANASAERTHIRVLDEYGAFADLTYQALHREAGAVAAGLLDLGVMPGDAVAIMLPTGRSYFTTFAGVLRAGAVPVPIYPPARPSQLADHLLRHIGILSNAQAVLLVTVAEALGLGGVLHANVDSLRHVVVPEALSGASVGALPRPRAENLALIQYTSGSTGQPKGVALTHSNLLANIRVMGQAAGVTGDDTFVSWLPLYHDMGLIGAWLSSMYFGVPLVVMAPQVFLTRPARWLRAIHAQRGTISAGPNFAYELCLAKIGDGELDGVDLSRWRLAFNGAEPVSPTTIERFANRFAPFGFRREAITPVYGLAESSVGLAFPPLGRGPLIDRVDRDTFVRSGRAVPAGPGARTALRFVACGRPLPGHEIRVVDGTGRELGDRHEGRIEFRGPSATSGYFRNTAATRALFHGDWLDTGDLGYLADADLYVTGRVKDVIIRAGRNLHPDELEEAIGNLPDVRKGCVAVFSSTPPGGGAERLVVMAETRASDGRDDTALRSTIVATTVDLLSVAPDEVVLAPPRTVPKTSSGKIRRTACREIYESGRVGATPPALWRELLGLRLRGAAPTLRRARGVIAAVAFAAYAWLVYAVLALSVLAVLALLPRLGWRQRVAGAAVRLLAVLTATPLVIRGRDHLPLGPAVVVANHPSWLDGLVLALALPRSFRFVAGEVLQRERLNGFVLARLGTVFVERHQRERGVADTDKVVALIRSGQSMVVFPEGGLDRAPGLRPFHMGGFLAAAQGAVPVVPVGLRGTRTILRPGNRFPRHGAIDVTIGHPITPTGADWSAAVAVQHAARDAVLALSGEPDLE